jgi:hypothetical protein
MSPRYEIQMIGLLEFIELLALLESIGFIALALVGLLEFVELLELGVKVFNESGVLFRNYFCLLIDFVEIFLTHIVLI